MTVKEATGRNQCYPISDRILSSYPPMILLVDQRREEKNKQQSVSSTYTAGAVLSPLFFSSFSPSLLRIFYCSFTEFDSQLFFYFFTVFFFHVEECQKNRIRYTIDDRRVPYSYSRFQKIFVTRKNTSDWKRIRHAHICDVSFLNSPMRKMY